MDKKILLIEDEANQVVLMKKRFEAAGYKFFYALDGIEGLKKAKDVRPDVILLDLTIPEISGFDVLKALKANETLKKIPVYVITARAEKHLGEDCKRYGAIDIIFKPYDSHELLELIKNSLH